MAEIDIIILDLFVRYVLPFLIGYLFFFHLCWGQWKRLFSFFRIKLLTYTLQKYWTKVYTCNDAEIKQMFTPLYKLERRDEDRRLRVMEIGIGSGSNFAFYPPNCDVFGVDPEEAIEPLLKENISKFDSLKLKIFKAAGAEDMSHMEDDSVDAVICTLVLCSVKDPTKVVEEVKRILRKVRERFFKYFIYLFIYCCIYFKLLMHFGWILFLSTSNGCLKINLFAFFVNPPHFTFFSSY